MIDLKAINKSFGALSVLNDVSLHVDSGEVVSIVGPSGAGKTTLLQIMGTLCKPDAGSLTIAGTQVLDLRGNALAQFRNRHLGFVFQFHQLLPEFTALENVMIPGIIAGSRERDVRKRAAELLDYLNLGSRADHKPAELSGGENQRVAVARALLNRPDVILADEPTGSLDSAHREELYRLFFDLREELGQTFVIVTHDEELAKRSDRTIHLQDGRVVNPD
ncbi:MAG: ABC transporter ATP-binding protein [Bacteroidaceae bacterium]|nr:ABC transporter ATP-binding protein [Bacteroidaceae bacterium]